MKLRARFTIWFVLAALVPIALAAVVTREVLSQSYADDYLSERGRAEASAQRDIEELKSRVVGQVDGLARMDHDFVGGIVIDLQKFSGRLPAAVRRQLVQRARSTMTSLDFDLLYVVGRDDTVLAAPHNRASRDSMMPGLRQQVRQAGGSAFFFVEDSVRGDTVESALVVAAGRTVRDQGQEVLVVAGQLVGDRLVRNVRREGRIDARMVSGQGAVLIPPAEAWAGQAFQGGIRLPLDGPAGQHVAFVDIAISDSELKDVQARVSVASLVLGGAALLVTVILGFAVARRITGDLDSLVAGAQAVSRDDYGHRIDVRSRDELGELANAFNVMVEDLEESHSRLAVAERIAAWQEIARRLAHEIKNPLTPIQMSVETMRRTHDKQHPSFDDIFEESTSTILEEVSRLKRIVAEFSEFARMPAARKADIDLNEVVTSATALYRGTIEVETVLEGRLPAVDADRDQITQVILNLLENARDAIDGAGVDAGRIRLTTRTMASAAAIELVVSDNGPGIRGEARDKLFTPYFTTKLGRGGTGLGLATVHRIVTEHGGKIRFGESDIGGAEFVVSLPTGPAPLALTFRSVRRDGGD